MDSRDFHTLPDYLPPGAPEAPSLMLVVLYAIFFLFMTGVAIGVSSAIEKEKAASVPAASK